VSLTRPSPFVALRIQALEHAGLAMTDVAASGPPPGAPSPGAPSPASARSSADAPSAHRLSTSPYRDRP
jgi:hypothetical protein